MVTYSIWREYDDLARAVINGRRDSPGSTPGTRSCATRTSGISGCTRSPNCRRSSCRTATSYFDYFYDILVDGRRSRRCRSVYVNGYATDSALAAGFDWYRAVLGGCRGENVRRSADPEVTHRCSTCAASMSARHHRVRAGFAQRNL